MTVEEVEAILGPGKPFALDQVPGFPVHEERTTRPVVEGDLIMRWENGQMYILVGFKGSKVLTKFFFEPSW